MEIGQPDISGLHYTEYLLSDIQPPDQNICISSLFNRPAALHWSAQIKEATTLALIAAPLR